MTKDAEKLLYCLYGIFKEKNKTESREEAKDMTTAEITEKCISIFNSEDVYDLLMELEENQYITTDVIGGVYLENSAIITIENKPKEVLNEIIDLISKLKFF